MQKFYRRSAPVLLSLAVWLLLWQMLSLRLDAEILLPAPLVVFRRFCALLVTAELWTAVLFLIEKRINNRKDAAFLT